MLLKNGSLSLVSGSQSGSNSLKGKEKVMSRNRAGFTLIELLLVVALIAIVTMVAVKQFGKLFGTESASFPANICLAVSTMHASDGIRCQSLLYTKPCTELFKRLHVVIVRSMAKVLLVRKFSEETLHSICRNVPKLFEAATFHDAPYPAHRAFDMIGCILSPNETTLEVLQVGFDS